MMLDIIYHDETLVVINKPSGLLVHRSPIDKRETRFALQLIRDQIGQRVYPVHRLDKPTSGVLLFALNSTAAQQLSDQFAARSVRKSYLALVRGYTASDGLIDYALQEQLDRVADAHASQDKPAQAAVTAYRCRDQFELPYPMSGHTTSRYSLLDLFPSTGRKHQLRRHMKHISHPIIGDTTHGDGRHNQLFREKFDCQRLLLHAACLEVKHPLTQHPLQFNAPLPADFGQIVQAMQALQAPKTT